MAQTTTVDKAELLKILTANRDRHRRVFEAALEGYVAEGIRQLEAKADKLRAGKLPTLRIGLIQPEDHTRDYNRVIRMVGMHQGDTWDMDETDFAQYVEDDWAWKRQWLTTSSAYAASSVKAEYGES